MAPKRAACDYAVSSLLAHEHGAYCQSHFGFATDPCLPQASHLATLFKGIHLPSQPHPRAHCHLWHRNYPIRVVALNHPILIARGCAHDPASLTENRRGDATSRAQHISPPRLSWGAHRHCTRHPLCAIELAAEPLYIRAQNELRVDVCRLAGGVAVFLKTFATFVGLAFASLGRLHNHVCSVLESLR